MKLLSRRQFLTSGAFAPAALAQTTRRPNIILIMSDDQGYGDLSLHGNETLKTPHLDSIGLDGVQFTQFHVNPVCSPTRSSLLTGRYYYRTGIVDTFLGRSMMYPEEVTLAEILRGAGYRTGIFGKWHLGDNYPMRCIDQGFETALTCTGGGLTQPSDPPGNHYFDPILQRNGIAEKVKGYCTDIFTNAAMEFIEQNRSRPFFCYLPTNAPHDPLEIADSYVKPFLEMGVPERTAKVYGMVRNIDENVGRLLAKVKALGIDHDTIVIFLTDNGPQHPRYNAGMRGHKTTVYEGGIRVPFFLRWPAMVKPGMKIPQLAAHIDVVPSLLEACGVKQPGSPRIDGVSLMPLIRAERRPWPDRTLYFQWHRGDAPELYRDCAARNQRWKLVNGKELYDLDADPAEKQDVAAQHAEIVASMRKGYEDWFRDVATPRHYEPARIYLGTKFENPTTLTRQDWRGPNASGNAGSLGYWEVDVKTAGSYEITFRMPAAPAEGTATFKLNGTEKQQKLGKGAIECTFTGVNLKAGQGRLEAILGYGPKSTGVHYVDVRKV